MLKLEPQVVIGQLREPFTIKTDTKETVDIGSWHGRAVWSYLRPHNGKKVDDRIKVLLNGEKMNNGNMRSIDLGSQFCIVLSVVLGLEASSCSCYFI